LYFLYFILLSFYLFLFLGIPTHDNKGNILSKTKIKQLNRDYEKQKKIKEALILSSKNIESELSLLHNNQNKIEINSNILNNNLNNNNINQIVDYNIDNITDIAGTGRKQGYIGDFGSAKIAKIKLSYGKSINLSIHVIIYLSISCIDLIDIIYFILILLFYLFILLILLNFLMLFFLRRTC
jgi:hypothetical protein